MEFPLYRRALDDVHAALDKTRIAAMLAWNDVRRRYRRSKLGQFWLTASMAVTIVGLAYVYGALFGQSLPNYIEHVAVSLILWYFIAGLVNDSCNAFVESESIVRNTDLPRTLFVLRIIIRNAIILGHNVLILPVLFLALLRPPWIDLPWLVVGLALVVLNGAWVGIVLSILCARFRDVPQIVASVMQIAFFVSPVIFKPNQLGDRAAWLVAANPFAHLLAIVRDPLLGTAPSLVSVGICLAMALIGWAIALPFAGRYAPRVVYWL